MDIELETERLFLREMRPEDAVALNEMQRAESYWQHQAVEPMSLPDTEQYIAEFLKRRGPPDDRRLYFFAAWPKAGGGLIGQISLMLNGYRNATIGFGVAEAHRRQGYGVEMAERMLAFGFKDARLHRIRAEATVDHAASIALLERIGMVREGVSRDCIFARGQWWTEAQYAILEDDFRARQAARAEAFSVAAE